MSESATSNVIHQVFNHIEDDPLIEPVVETLLYALERVRLGEITSIAIVGCNEAGNVRMSCPSGVRMDQTPSIVGLLAMLQAELSYGYEFSSVSEHHTEDDETP